MVKIEIYGSITENHTLEIHNRKKLLQELSECSPCEVLITIKKRGKRSNAQNSYYHGVIIETLRHRLIELGHRVDHETVHEWVKSEFNSLPLADADGVMIAKIPQSTTDLNKSEFSDLIERIRAFAAEHLGIDIPDADKSLSMNFE